TAAQYPTTTVHHLCSSLESLVLQLLRRVAQASIGIFNQIQHPLRDRVMHEIGACMKPQFFVNSCTISLYRFHAHAEFRCSSLGRKSYCNLTKNLRLAATEALHIGPAHCARSAEQQVGNGIAEAWI